MKTHSIEWSHIDTAEAGKTLNPADSLNTFFQLATKIFIAAVPVLAIVIGAAWAMSIPNLDQYLQATLWASGFVFLALALETDEASTSLWFLASGLALPILALLASRVAGEFVIVAATLVAAWVAVAILRR